MHPVSGPDVPPASPFSLEALVTEAHSLSLPRLGQHGEELDFIPQDSRPAGLSITRHGDVLTGRWRGECSGKLHTTTRSAYELILHETRGCNMARIWNIVPQINDSPDGLENYRAFCSGRAEAFHNHFGARASVSMPAATGIGGSGPFLDISFIAFKEAVRHFENPEQVPAYNYPPQYGPRPPSFARASMCRTNEAIAGFVSGTASIKGHSSITGNIDIECDNTLNNLRLIGQVLDAAGLPYDTPRVVNVFIRNNYNTSRIISRLCSEWLAEHDTVHLHRADICRAELGLEIEYAACSANSP